jgi:hypothetical protein
MNSKKFCSNPVSTEYSMLALRHITICYVIGVVMIVKIHGNCW